MKSTIQPNTNDILEAASIWICYIISKGIFIIKIIWLWGHLIIVIGFPKPRQRLFVLNEALDDVCLTLITLYDVFICRSILLMVSRFYVLHYLCRVHPKNYAHSLCFVVFCYVCYGLSFIHILQGCFTATGAIIWLPQWQWSNPEGYR